MPVISLEECKNPTQQRALLLLLQQSPKFFKENLNEVSEEGISFLLLLCLADNYAYLLSHIDLLATVTRDVLCAPFVRKKQEDFSLGEETCPITLEQLTRYQGLIYLAEQVDPDSGQTQSAVGYFQGYETFRNLLKSQQEQTSSSNPFEQIFQSMFFRGGAQSGISASQPQCPTTRIKLKSVIFLRDLPDTVLAELLTEEKTLRSKSEIKQLFEDRYSALASYQRNITSLDFILRAMDRDLLKEKYESSHPFYLLAMKKDGRKVLRDLLNYDQRTAEKITASALYGKVSQEGDFLPFASAFQALYSDINGQEILLILFQNNRTLLNNMSVDDFNPAFSYLFQTQPGKDIVDMYYQSCEVVDMNIHKLCTLPAPNDSFVEPFTPIMQLALTPEGRQFLLLLSNDSSAFFKGMEAEALVKKRSRHAAQFPDVSLYDVLKQFEEGEVLLQRILEQNPAFNANIDVTDAIMNDPTLLIMKTRPQISAEEAQEVCCRYIGKDGKVPDINCALRRAAANGELQDVMRLSYCDGIDFSEQSSNGNTALLWAKSRNHHDVVDFLQKIEKSLKTGVDFTKEQAPRASATHETAEPEGQNIFADMFSRPEAGQNPFGGMFTNPTSNPAGGTSSSSMSDLITTMSSRIIHPIIQAAFSTDGQGEQNMGAAIRSRLPAGCPSTPCNPITTAAFDSSTADQLVERLAAPLPAEYQSYLAQHRMPRSQQQQPAEIIQQELNMRLLAFEHINFHANNRSKKLGDIVSKLALQIIQREGLLPDIASMPCAIL